MSETRNTYVWLPVKFQHTVNESKATPLSEDQLDELIGYYAVSPEDMVSPEPMGIRQVFAWRLAADLKKKSGSALEEFGLLVEGLLYGFLNAKTFDLGELGLGYEAREERYLTVLEFKSGPTAAASVAGAFSPGTLVCPAANWTEKAQLENLVKARRAQPEGSQARALVRLFLDEYNSPNMPWYQALRWFLGKYPVSPLDPGEANQHNVGPLQLRLQEGNDPVLIFFPCYSRGFIDRLVTAMQSDTLAPDEDRIVATHHGVQVARALNPTHSMEPALFGLGTVEFLESNPSRLPASADFSPGTKKRMEGIFHNVLSLYQSPSRFGSPDVARCAHASLGAGAGQGQWIYGPSVLRAGLNPLPNYRYDKPCIIRDANEHLVVVKTHGGALAFYVERYGGRELGELSRLGYSLWRIFNGCGWDASTGQAVEAGQVILQDMDGWIGAPISMPVGRPDPLREIMSWSTFLHLAGTHPEGLFKAAAEAYIAAYGSKNVAPLNRMPTHELKIGDYPWYSK